MNPKPIDLHRHDAWQAGQLGWEAIVETDLMMSRTDADTAVLAFLTTASLNLAAQACPVIEQDMVFAQQADIIDQWRARMATLADSFRAAGRIPATHHEARHV